MKTNRPITTLKLAKQSIRTLTVSELRIAVGGGRNPKPTPSTRVSCASARCNTH